MELSWYWCAFLKWLLKEKYFLVLFFATLLCLMIRIIIMNDTWKGEDDNVDWRHMYDQLFITCTMWLKSFLVLIYRNYRHAILYTGDEGDNWCFPCSLASSFYPLSLFLLLLFYLRIAVVSPGNILFFDNSYDWSWLKSSDKRMRQLPAGAVS